MTQFLRPFSDLGVGLWTTNAGGVVFLYQSIDEEVRADSDYVRSPTSPANATYQTGLESGLDPLVSTGHVLKYAGGKDAAAGRTIGITATLKQGTTTIASFTDANVSNAITEFPHALSVAQADLITDYTDLNITFSANQTGSGAARRGIVTWAVLELPDVPPAATPPFGWSLSYGRNRIVTSGPDSPEDDLIFIPRGGARGRRGVVLLPGQLQTVLHFHNEINLQQRWFLQALMTADIPGVSINAGVANWGWDDAVADIELARTYLSNIGCATDKIVIVGASAGVMDGLNYMREHPTLVSGFIGVMPPCDLDDVRDNNRGNARDNINTAWGMPLGSTSATFPLPTRANPNTTTNANLIASSGAPMRLYYSTVDELVIPSTVESFATKVGITPTIISTEIGHSDALFSAVPPTDMVNVILDAL